MDKKIPRFIAEQYTDGAQGFRVKHRKALRALSKALDDAREGCAYTPSYQHLLNATKEINDAIEACRPSNWERKPLGKTVGEGK